LLKPEDYGVVALAMGIVFIVNRLSGVGFEATMLRQSVLTPRQISSLFWAKAIVVTLAFLLCLAIAALAQAIYSPTVILIVVVFGVLQSVNSMTFLPGTLLQRDLKFRQFQMVEIGMIFITTLAGIAMAIAGWGPWALVFSIGGGIVLNGMWKWSLTGWKPMLVFDVAYVRSQFRFSAGMLATGVLEESVHRVDDILLGTFIGAQALGYYGMAYNLSQFYHNNISGAVQQVALPVMGKVQEDGARLKRVLEQIIPYLLYTSGLFYALFAPLAVEIITLLYGEKWRPAAFLLQGLALYGFLLPLFETARLILIVRGKSMVMAQVYAAEAAVLIGLMVLLLPVWGAFGAVIAVDAMILCACALTVYFVQRELQTHSPDWFSVIGLPIIAMLLTALGVSAARQSLSAYGVWIEIAGACAAGLAIWVAIIWSLDRQRVFDDARLFLARRAGTRDV
jgi:O-antigen/teichoic acid export membrane protein